MLPDFECDAMAHGTICLSSEYDTATALVKPLERNTRYVDAVLTVRHDLLDCL